MMIGRRQNFAGFKSLTRPALGADLRGARRVKLQPGRGLSLTKTGLGDALGGAEEGSTWKHPWQTTPLWDSVRKRWVAVVQPGFVNGQAPVTSLTIEETEDSPCGINPLTGERYFSSYIFDQQGTGKNSRVDVPLYDFPAIEMVWRNVGWDGEDEVPKFFLDRGVQRPKDLTQDLMMGNVNLADLSPKAGNRLLRACDLVLHQPRRALTSQITLEPGIVTGVSNATQLLGIKSPTAGDKLKVSAKAKFAPSNGGLNALLYDYEEEPWDERVVATVFLLSPLHTPPGSVPDGTWQPFVRHELFWNLAYREPRFGSSLDAGGNDVHFIVLAGGAAQIAINFLTASINDLLQQAYNIVTANSMGGSWWTPTAGGADSEAQPEITAAGDGTKYGLDKDSRLAAKRKAAAAKKALRLNPAFPYRGISFPEELLT